MEAQIKLLFLTTVLFLDSVAARSVVPATEWRALLDLRRSLGIRAKHWPKKVNPCLNWTGIHCAANGHVTEINLSGLRRTQKGMLNPLFAVDSLPGFPMLSVFNSSGFSLRGSIPNWFGLKLSNLTVLDLSSSSIYGSIPGSLKGLTKLTSLFLARNSITGSMPPTLGLLPSLSVLDLSQNLLTGQISTEIWSVRNLTSLDLSSNYLSGSIVLDRSSLHNLKYLNLSKNSLSGMIPGELGNLSELTELDLGFNSLSGSLPEELGSLKELQKMSFSDNELDGSLSDALFHNLTLLEYLVLRGNSFVGQFPVSLLSMSHLKYLDVSRNNLTGVLPSFNASGSSFNLSNNQFYGNLNISGARFNFFDVSSNYFNGSVPNVTNGTSLILLNNCLSNERKQKQRDSDICRKFYMEVAHSGNDTVQVTQLVPAGSHHRRRFLYIMIGVFGGLAFIVLVMSATVLFRRLCCTKNVDNENVTTVPLGVSEEVSKVVINVSCLGVAFTYAEMVLATGNFSTENLIKHGHSGDLFRGTLEGGRLVVVKRVDLRFIKEEVFMLELEFFGKVSHPKFVPLIGHCLEDEHEKFLVYKYMLNGDLSNALYKLTESEENMRSLDWITRLKIATGAAEALSYLHHECAPPVVHRDIQASSILLDDKYEVRLGSFSEVITLERHKMRPKLLHAPQTSGKRPSGSSPAYDVYCFGKVLLELVTGKLGTTGTNNADEKQWLDTTLPFISMQEKEMVIKIVDQSLIIDDDLLEEVWAVSLLARACLNPKASRRPSMRNVLKALENPFKVVREENLSSALLRTTSRQSWTAALFGSWHNSSSCSSNKSGQTNRESSSDPKQSERVGSRGSGTNDHSSSYKSSHKQSSSDVFPEPVDTQDVERQDRTT